MCSTGAKTDANTIDLAPWGYAPGSNFFHCCDCPAGYEGHNLYVGHKHSIRCASHALAARQEAIRIHEGNLVPDPDQQLADAALEMVRVMADKMIRRAFIASLILAPMAMAALIIFSH